MADSIKRLFFVVIGWICVCLGFLGIFLPLLPTTPFLLLASACFMRGSPRFHAWLIQHKTFGPIIVQWNEHGAVSPAIKRRASLLMVMSFSFSIWLVPTLWQKIMLVVLGASLLFWFNRLPEYEPVAEEPENN